LKQAPKNIQALIVARADEGLSLQDFLALKLNLSRRRAQALVESKNVWVNRQRVWMAHHALKPGDHIQAPLEKEQKRQAPKLRVLFEDDFYLFTDKPAGIVSVGDNGVEDALRLQFNNPALQAVHRLDRDTSGCLLVAKSPAAHAAVVSVFKTRRVMKLYVAIVAGRVQRSVSTINEELEGLRAVTHLSVIRAGQDATYLRLRIETGRTHQIRRHLTAARHPVLGDREYGPKDVRDPRMREVPRQMLHAVEIEMPHPMVPGAELRAHSPLPADFRRCLKAFEL
jgi:RluA family pseudouridine synthase